MQTEPDKSRPVITLLTDFGRADHFVGVMKGVVAGICPRALVIDISHDIPPQNLLAGAVTLLFSYSYFPPGTIHVVVVDPGVGSGRRIVACRAAEYIFLAPDNGILWPTLERAETVESVRVEEKSFFLANVSDTFHGRDIFAPVAAHLARGVQLKHLGPPVEKLLRLELPRPSLVRPDAIRGEVIYIDHFGNLISNIPAQMLEKLEAPESKLVVRVADATVRGLSRSYAGVPVGKLLGLIGSTGFLEIAARGASACQITGATRGDAVEVVRE